MEAQGFHLATPTLQQQENLARAEWAENGLLHVKLAQRGDTDTLVMESVSYHPKKSGFRKDG